MKDLLKTIQYLTIYSSFLQSNLPKILSDNSKSIKHVVELLSNNPIPVPILQMYRMNTNTTGKTVHIPIHVNRQYGFRTKMIIWDPNSAIEEHYHGHEDCFFQPIHIGMLQTLYQDELSITTGVRTTEFSFINDQIGSHSLKNSLNSQTNTSFHLYIDSHTRV